MSYRARLGGLSGETGWQVEKNILMARDGVKDVACEGSVEHLFSEFHLLRLMHCDRSVAYLFSHLHHR